MCVCVSANPAGDPGLEPASAIHGGAAGAGGAVRAAVAQLAIAAGVHARHRHRPPPHPLHLPARAHLRVRLRDGGAHLPQGLRASRPACTTGSRYDSL